MRHYDWPERLADYLLQVKGMSFEWGKNDCALFVCNCIELITGEDHASKFRGKYRTEKGALLALKRIGKVPDLPSLATDKLGPPINILMASRGDIVEIVTDLGPTLGVVFNDKIFFVGLQGLCYFPVSMASRAWKVD